MTIPKLPIQILQNQITPGNDRLKETHSSVPPRRLCDLRSMLKITPAQSLPARIDPSIVPEKKRNATDSSRAILPSFVLTMCQSERETLDFRCLGNCQYTRGALRFH